MVHAFSLKAFESICWSDPCQIVQVLFAAWGGEVAKFGSFDSHCDSRFVSDALCSLGHRVKHSPAYQGYL